MARKQKIKDQAPLEATPAQTVDEAQGQKQEHKCLSCATRGEWREGIVLEGTTHISRCLNCQTWTIANHAFCSSECGEDNLPAMPAACLSCAHGPNRKTSTVDNWTAAAAPATFTFSADVEAVYEDKYVLTVTNTDGGKAKLEFPKDAVFFEGKDIEDLEDGYLGIEFTVAYAEAAERHMPEFLGRQVVDTVTIPETEDTQPPRVNTPVILQGRPDLKWQAEEAITVTQELSNTEKLEYGQEMADALAKIEEHEAELDGHKKHFKRLIETEEKKAKSAAKLYREGKEEREVLCDRAADFKTCEIIWADAYTGEIVDRRPMTHEELQLPLPIEAVGGRKAPEPELPQAEDAPADNVTVYGHFEGETETGILFTVYYKAEEGPPEQFEIPREQVIRMEAENPDTNQDELTVSRAYALEAGIITEEMEAAPIPTLEQVQAEAGAIQ